MEGANALEDSAQAIASSVAHNSSFNIVGAARNIDILGLLGEPLRDGFELSAVRALRMSRDDEFKSRQSRRNKSLIAKEIFPSLQLSEQLALDWLEQRGASLVSEIGRETKKAIIKAVRDGITHGWDIRRMADAISDYVGLTHRNGIALSKYRSSLESQEIDTEQIKRMVDRYRNRLLKNRAENIARTESINARNAGQLNAWQSMQADEELPIIAKKRWIAAKSERTCPICVELGKHEPVPIDQPFRSSIVGSIMAPGAHPSCRCSMGLV
jgi:hypothetical protein